MRTTLEPRRFRARAVSAVIGIVAAAFYTAAPALAGHAHRVSGYYHGLGDGANNNNYVHPFIDGHRDYKIINVYKRRDGRDFLRSNRCRDCGHVHLNQDTNATAECFFYMWSSQPYGNYHFHHNWCG